MIYDFECIMCCEKQEDVLVHKKDDPILCPSCKGEMIRLFPANSRFYAHIFPADGIFLEHVSPEGKRFHTKKEMKQYAKEHDLELGAL